MRSSGVNSSNFVTPYRYSTMSLYLCIAAMKSGSCTFFYISDPWQINVHIHHLPRNFHIS
jgi:hypothetical protein